MKVIQITTSSKGGAGIAALRLHEALRANGVESAYLSKDLAINFNGQVVEDSFFEYKRQPFFKQLLRKIKNTFSSDLKKQTLELLGAKKNQLSYEIITTPFSSYDLEKHWLVKEADVLNLHWVSGILDYSSFFSSNSKPIVWTLHDMNPFKGLFHYSDDEISNGKYVGALDDELKALKTSAIGKIKKGALVTPSNWLLEEAKESEVFEHFSIKECIPNGINFPENSVAIIDDERKSMGLDPTEFVLLFTAGFVDVSRKGMDLLLQALEEVLMPVTLLIAGEGAIEVQNSNIKIVPLGFVDTHEKMRKIYRVADCFVLPSREDNLPNTMLESFSQGTPVISFAIGGMKEHITDGITGVLASEVTAKALAHSINMFYNNKDQFNRERVKDYAQTNFSYHKQANTYKEVYLQIYNQG